MNLFLAILSIFLIVGAFLGGMAVVYFLQPANPYAISLTGDSKDAVALCNSQSAAIKNLMSPAVNSIVARGNIKSVDSKTIVLSLESSTISIKLPAKVTINDVSVENTSVASKLSDLKVGYFVNVATKIIADGSLEAFSILILTH